MPNSSTTSQISNELRQRLLNIYTPLELAVSELNSSTRKALRSKLDPAESPLRRDHQFAIHVGHVATPNFGIERFLRLASDAQLEPLFWEYHRDKFVTCNPCKRALGRMGFFVGRNRLMASIVTYRNLLRFSQDGLAIADVQTLWGQSLTEFHHDLLLTTWPQIKPASFWDASVWYAAHGPTPLDYYRKLFALMLSGGILFESFLLDSIEIEFTRDVVLKAFYEVWDAFGLKPLVVRLDPPECEGDPFWLLYRHETQQHVHAKLRAAIP